MKSQEKSERKVKKEKRERLCGGELSGIKDEERRIRWLRLQVDVTGAVLYQDPELDLATARTIVLELRRTVLERFPGKEGAFDLILLPRFERILRERWGRGLFDGERVQ